MAVLMILVVHLLMMTLNLKPAKIAVDIKVTSLDSNHAERDKHLRSKDFLDTDAFPSAKFVSTSYKSTGPKTADLSGDLTLHGVTKPVVIAVEAIGAGKDPGVVTARVLKVKPQLNLPISASKWKRNSAPLRVRLNYS